MVFIRTEPIRVEMDGLHTDGSRSGNIEMHGVTDVEASFGGHPESTKGDLEDPGVGLLNPYHVGVDDNGNLGGNLAIDAADPMLGKLPLHRARRI